MNDEPDADAPDTDPDSELVAVETAVAVAIAEDDEEVDSDHNVGPESAAGAMTGVVVESRSPVSLGSPAEPPNSRAAHAHEPDEGDESEADHGERSPPHSESFDCEHMSESSGEVHTSYPGPGDAAAGVGTSDAGALEDYVHHHRPPTRDRPTEIHYSHNTEVHHHPVQNRYYSQHHHIHNHPIHHIHHHHYHHYHPYDPFANRFNIPLNGGHNRTMSEAVEVIDISDSGSDSSD